MRRSSTLLALLLLAAAAPLYGQVQAGRTGYAPTIVLMPLDGAPEGGSLAALAFDGSRGDPLFGLAAGYPLAGFTVVVQGAARKHDVITASGEGGWHPAGSAHLERGLVGGLSAFAGVQADRPLPGMLRIAAPAGLRLEASVSALGVELTPYALGGAALREDRIVDPAIREDGGQSYRDRGLGFLGTVGLRAARGPVWLQASLGTARGVAGYDPPAGSDVESVTHGSLRIGFSLDR